jgi:hypothetical protein
VEQGLPGLRIELPELVGYDEEDGIEEVRLAAAVEADDDVGAAVELGVALVGSWVPSTGQLRP